MTLKRASLLLVSLALAAWLGAGLAQAAEFSANVVTHMNSQETKGKVYVSGQKMRREFSTPEGTNITIARPDKKVMWVFMPGQKMYMEMQFRPSQMEKAMKMPKDQKGEMKLLGKETVNGYETEKFETTFKHKGAPVKQYIWVSKKLGVPVKVTSQDGSFSMEYLDIKEGNVPASLFEVPKGYRKMRMPPGMPQGMPPK
jgi:outer membrane lipoprotein-sorting protein